MNDRDKTIRYGIPLADPDGLERWRADAERHEQEFEQERTRAERQQRRERRYENIADVRNEVADLRNDVSGLREEMRERSRVSIEVLGQELGAHADRIEDTLTRLIELERKVAEQVATKPRGFDRFANERDSDGPVDLPNPLSRRELN